MDYLSEHSTADKTKAKRKRIGLAALVATVVVGGSAAAMGIANASTTPTPSDPAIVASPGAQLGSGQVQVIQIAGETFGATAVPSNATAATVSITSVNPSNAGDLTVYTTGARRPGTPTVSFNRHQNVTDTADVTLDGSGRLSVYSSARTRFTMRLLSYDTPDRRTGGSPSCVSTIYTIPASTATLAHVGGSIRTGATDFGDVSLPRGTYDTRVIGGFTGFNNSDTWLPAGVFLTGTMVVVKGATIAADFSNDVTAGGAIIPKSNSNTLTQDPTLAISTFLVLTATTDVHVQLFAYASDSSSAGSGQVKANVQSAQFRKVC